MRQPFFLFILMLFISTISFSQVTMPAEVAQRLGNDRSFDRYAFEMMRYVKAKQRTATDSVLKKYYLRQEKFIARHLWYLEARQDNLGNICNYPEKIDAEIRRYSAARPSSVEAANGAWSLVGPTNNVASALNASRGQGRVDRIAFHPTDPDIVYAGTPCSGLWKSINGGATWSVLNSFIPNLSISGIVVSWADPNDIYVLTGDGDSNGGDNAFVQGFDYIRPSIGVLKSTDGGATWEKTGDMGIDGFYTGYKLIQSPTNASLLIAATSEGLYRTTNGGASWTLVSPNTDRYFDVEWKPGSSLRVYAVSSNNFYISINAGGEFTNQDDNFNIAFDYGTRMAIAVTPANTGYVYVFIGYAPGGTAYNKGIYKSTNSGDNFTKGCSDNYNDLVANPWYTHNIAASPTNAELLIMGSVSLFKSTGGGSACPFQLNQGGDASLANFAHADVHEITFNPLNGDLFIGTDGGVHKSTDDGATLTTCYSMSTTQLYHFDVSDTDNNYILGGAQDNGIQLKSGASSVFSHFASGDGYDIEFNPNTTGPAYFSVNQRLFKTDVNLTTYTQMPDIPDDWYKTVSISRFNNNIAYASSGAVYKTTNGGGSWVNKGASGRWALITCQSSANRVYAAGGSGWNDGGTQASKKLQRTDDAGDTWIELQENPGFPETITKITGLAVDPVNSSHVWATMGGFTDGQKVYYSANAGANWTNLTGSLPNVPINCVAIDNNADVYIGTDIGVFFRTATMTDWQPFYNQMPRIPVTELHIRSNTIFASTFGRGIWKSETHTDCPADLSVNSSLYGYRFYEALNITSSSTLAGGDGTQVFFRGQNSVTLTENFRVNASTGETFRAWLANCNSGGIPVLTSANSAGLKLSNNQIEFTMPFDAKASLAIIDTSGKVQHIISDNEIYAKGNIKINYRKAGQFKGKLVLMIDGEISGMIDL